MNTDKEKDYIDDTVKKVDGCLTFMIGCFISFALGIFADISYEKHNISTPVENTVKVDSLTTINDSIKIFLSSFFIFDSFLFKISNN